MTTYSRGFFGTSTSEYTPADCICDIKQLLSPPGCMCGGGRRAIEAARARVDNVDPFKEDPYQKYADEHGITRQDFKVRLLGAQYGIDGNKILPVLNRAGHVPLVKETYQQTVDKLVKSGLRTWHSFHRLDSLKVGDYVRVKASGEIGRIDSRASDGSYLRVDFDENGYSDMLTVPGYWEVLV